MTGIDFAIFAANKISEKAVKGDKLYEQVFWELLDEFKSIKNISTNHPNQIIGRDSDRLWYGTGTQIVESEQKSINFGGPN